MGDYLRARGPEYAKFLQWNRYCMDTEDDENNQKAGPYDEVIGAYKSVTGFLGHAPTYPLAGKSISSPDDLEAFDKETIAHEMNHNMRERVLGSNGRPSPGSTHGLRSSFRKTRDSICPGSSPTRKKQRNT